MSALKRKRNPNWLPSEKLLLLDIIEKHLNVIEYKKTDTASIARKLAEWRVISDEYNSQAKYMNRTATNLKSLWDSLKKQTRKKESEKRKHTIHTVDEPPQNKEDLIHSRIIGFLELSSRFDSDPLAPLESEFKSNQEENTDIILESEVKLDEENADSILSNSINESMTEDEEENWSDYPRSLHTHISSPIRRNRENIEVNNFPSKSSKIEDLHKKKIEAMDLKNKFARDDIKKKAKINKLDYAIKAEILKQERIRTRMLLLELKMKKRQCFDVK